MTIMKESKLIEMKRQLDVIAGALNNLLRDHQNLRTLAYGTHETLKNIKGYDEALKKLQDKLKAEQDKNGQEQGDSK